MHVLSIKCLGKQSVENTQLKRCSTPQLWQLLTGDLAFLKRFCTDRTKVGWVVQGREQKQTKIERKSRQVPAEG